MYNDSVTQSFWKQYKIRSYGSRHTQTHLIENQLVTEIKPKLCKPTLLVFRVLDGNRPLINRQEQI